MKHVFLKPSLLVFSNSKPMMECFMPNKTLMGTYNAYLNVMMKEGPGNPLAKIQ